MKCPTAFISGYLSCIIPELHGGMGFIQWRILFCVIADPTIVCCFAVSIDTPQSAYFTQNSHMTYYSN